GVKVVEDKNGYHGKPLPDPEEAIQELGGERNLRVTPASPDDSGSPHRFQTEGGDPPQWELGEEVATRNAYGEALAALGRRGGDRRGRPFADGARGLRGAASGPLKRRRSPLGRKPGAAAGGADGRPRGDLLHEDAPWKDHGSHPAGGGHPNWRQPARALQRG